MTIMHPHGESTAVLSIELDSLWSRQALSAALDEVVAETHDLTTVVQPYDVSFFRFEFVHENDGAQQTYSEEFFFNRTVFFDELDAKTLQYVANVVRYNETAHERCPSETAWHDAMHQAGCYAIESLVMKSAAYISNYVSYLKSNDDEHESGSYGFIPAVIEKYGWRTETLDLVAARILSAGGQNGQELFLELNERFGLSSHLNANQRVEEFALTMFLGHLLSRPYLRPRSEMEKKSEAELALADSYAPKEVIWNQEYLGFVLQTLLPAGDPHISQYAQRGKDLIVTNIRDLGYSV